MFFFSDFVFLPLRPQAGCSGGMQKLKDDERDEVVLGDKDTLSGSWGIGTQPKLEGVCQDEELLEAVVRLVFGCSPGVLWAVQRG